LDLITQTTEECIEFCACGGPEQLTTFIENRSDSDELSAIEKALTLLYKTTSWMMDPNLDEKMKTLKFNYASLWNSRIAFAILLGNMKNHYSDKEALVELCTKLLLLLANLDSQCLQTVIRSAQASFANQPQSNDMETQNKPESTYSFIKQVLDIAYATSDRISFAQASSLAFAFAKNALTNAPQLPSARSYVQKTLNSPLLAEANVQRNIATGFLKHLASGDAAVFDVPECEELAKRVVSNFFDSLTSDQKGILTKNAGVYLKARAEGLKNAVSDGNSSQIDGFVTSVIQILKAALVLLPTSALPEFGNANAEILSSLNAILANESFQKVARLEEFKTLLSKFSAS